MNAALRFGVTLSTAVSITAGITACTHTDEDRVAALEARNDRPEQFLPSDLSARADSGVLARRDTLMDKDEEAQPDSLPPLPFGMTLDMIRDGDKLFRGKGGCVNCHGSEAQGLPARGKTLTAGLHFLPPGDWRGVDSIVSVGLPDAITRSPVAMPPRGQHGDLSVAEIRAVSAYVWAISSVKGEPWSGGHAAHAPHDPRSSARTSIP
jgi:cytochrome c5